MDYDNNSLHKAELALAAVAYAAIANGPVIDLFGFNSATFIIHTGTLGTGTIDFILEESDVVTFGGEETVVAAADIVGALPTILATEDDSVFRFGYIGKKQFIRLRNVETASWTSMIHGAVAFLGHARHQPVDAQIT